MTKWTYDEPVHNLTDDSIVTLPVAAIYLIPPDDSREITTIDLMGTHVLLDVDPGGNVVSVTILGPAVFLDLRNLGEFLGEPASILKAEE